MRQITLRGIPDNIETLAQEEAKSKGVSLNKAFISLLRRGAEQQTSHRRKSHSEASEFSRFLGLWKEEDADTFDESLRQQRDIDKDIWS
jgi:hypothetical protein